MDILKACYFQINARNLNLWRKQWPRADVWGVCYCICSLCFIQFSLHTSCAYRLASPGPCLNISPLCYDSSHFCLCFHLDVDYFLSLDRRNLANVAAYIIHNTWTLLRMTHLKWNWQTSFALMPAVCVRAAASFSFGLWTSKNRGHGLYLRIRVETH